MPRKPVDEDDDEAEYQPPPTRLPPEVIGVWERKRRLTQSRKDAAKMWAPILEGFRAYSETLTYVHELNELNDWMR